jgi:hypothetical protein
MLGANNRSGTGEPLVNGRYQNRYDEEWSKTELGWRAYQPSWAGTLITSVGIAGVMGGIAFLQSGNLLTLQLAGIASLLLIVFSRWIYPMYQHIVWGDPETPP